MSPIGAVPHFLSARNSGVAWAFCTFATGAKLSMTMFDDDDGGGGGETTKPCSSNVPHGVIKTVCACRVKVGAQ